MLYSNLILTLPRDVFQQVSRPNSVYMPCLPILTTCPAHHRLPNFTILTIIGTLCKSHMSFLCNILNYFSSISSFLSPNIFLSSLSQNTCNLSSSINEWHHVSHSYKPNVKTIVLYKLIFSVLESTQHD